jgi:hypothetical protein
VDVAAADERRRGAGPGAIEEDVDPGQVLGVVAQLDPRAREGGVDGVAVAFQGDGGGAARRPRTG